MPNYRYKCPSCSFQWDVVKSINDIDSLEKCDTCGRGNIEGSCRVIGAVNFYGEKPDEPFYSQALGKMVRSKKHQAQEAKQRGWEELGTTDIEKHIDRTDSDREKKAQGKWDELLRG